MKRTYLNLPLRILCLLLCLSLFSCSAPLPTGTETQGGAETQETAQTETVCEETTQTEEKKLQGDVAPKMLAPLPLSTVDKIPIATDGMSVDELRQICVDFMRLEMTFPWQPAKSVTYKVNDRITTLTASTVYSGTPYISNTTSGLYQLLRYYDEETGLVDTAAMGNRAKDILGNQCSGSTFWAWAKVSNSISWGGTPQITPYYGAVLIGPYTHDNTSFTSTTTSSICQKNGDQVMFESYAALQKGDGIVCNAYGTGHVEMAIADAVVVRNPDGTIDGKKSHCRFLDHTGTLSHVVTADGILRENNYGKGHEYSFTRLLGLGYLPFSLPEFHGTDPVEKAECTLDVADEPLTLKSLMKGSIQSNYYIAEISIYLYDSCGKLVGERFYCSVDGYKKSLSATVLGPTVLLQRETENASSAEILVRLATGERIAVYSGPFIG
ncbi:MAG: hypothetical protein IJC84_04755 [Clostridia bacterium]|nr:hypothetical protein [Clostridia bacterium]